MSKTCVACKTNPAIMMASVMDKETGAYSPPVPLCENCYLKISKTRTIKITESDSPAYRLPVLPGPVCRRPADFRS